MKILRGQEASLQSSKGLYRDNKFYHIVVTLVLYLPKRFFDLGFSTTSFSAFSHPYVIWYPHSGRLWGLESKDSGVYSVRDSGFYNLGVSRIYNLGDYAVYTLRDSGVYNLRDSAVYSVRDSGFYNLGFSKVYSLGDSGVYNLRGQRGQSKWLVQNMRETNSTSVTLTRFFQHWLASFVWDLSLSGGGATLTATRSCLHWWQYP